MFIGKRGKMKESKVIEEKEADPAENEPFLSELHEQIWSLVSFEKCIESGLTYDEAVKKMDELFPKQVPGLCIVTDEAAENI